MTEPAANFLFTTIDGGGNVAPMMALVAQLVERSHRVRVMTEFSVREEVVATGATFVPWRRAPNRDQRSRESDPPDWTVTAGEGIRMLFEHFIGPSAPAHALDVAEELDREPASVVVSYEALMGVMAVCEARRQKLALLSTSISLFPAPGTPPFGSALAPARGDAEAIEITRATAAARDRSDAALPGLNAARDQHGLHPLQHLDQQVQAAAIYFVGTARAFDFPPQPQPDRMRYVGPLLRDPGWAGNWISPWPAGDPRPLVVVGFSTSFQNHADCLQRIIDAATPLPVRVMVTLGGSIRADELNAGVNTLIVANVPHTVVMPDASLVVTHGGHGTLLTALANGLPVLVMPHGRDQGDNAVRVEAHGVGLSLPNTASVMQIRDALQTLLQDARFRAAAGRLGAAIREEIRASTLIDDLESLART